MRLIDADALTKRIEEVYCKDCDNHNEVMCRSCEYMCCMDFIEDAPTIDAQIINTSTIPDIARDRVLDELARMFGGGAD